MTDLQSLFNACLRKYYATIEDSQGINITGRRRRSDADGKGLEVPCVHTSLGKPRNCLSYYLWRRLQTARTSCLPFNRLSSKPQQSQDFSKCHATSNVHFLETELAVFKATTLTKEFSKCHSRWRLCPFPRIVFYWLLRSQDFLKCHDDFSKCHGVAVVSRGQTLFRTEGKE